ncbi:hypothetical protein SXCC_01605 [Gluconacetobacter sp. SXCC-1]|nr:hypothetical protein SXCC_01605 [Gluconacetobacter sp. SXCC-1]
MFMADRLYAHNIQGKAHGLKSYFYLIPVMTHRACTLIQAADRAHP